MYIRIALRGIKKVTKTYIVFFVCGSLNMHGQYPIGAKDMLVCLKLSQSLCYMSANSKDSGEVARMRRLT